MRTAPLFFSSLIYQLVRDPVDIFNKASIRLRGRPAGPRTTFAPLGGVRTSDFDVPITRSSGGLERERVLHVLTNSFPYSRGGYAHRSHEIIRALNAEGFEATAITRLAYPAVIGAWELGQEDKVEEVLYARALPFFHPMTFSKSMKVQAEHIVLEATKKGAGILHTTTPWPNAVATSAAAREMGIPWVYEVRGEPEATWAAAQPEPQQALESAFYRASRNKETEAMKAAAAVITLSDISKRDLQQRGVNDVHVVPNAVRESERRDALSPEIARAKMGLASGTYVGSVSSIVDYEGFDDLIRALQYLPKDTKVLLVGDGSAVPRLKQIAVECGVEDRVVFAGWQESETIANWYSALDVFVAPRKDTRVTRVVTPMKIQRAQSLGIPVVCSDLPALREVTSNQAIYVPAENAKLLAEGLREALAMESPRRTSNRIITWENAASSLVDIYRGVV